MSTYCPNCGRETAPGAAACPICGARTVALETAVVSVELAGFDRLAPALSADDLGDFAERFLGTAERVARQWDGEVVRGDDSEVAVVFGGDPPTAARNGVLCALALRAALRDLVTFLPAAAAEKTRPKLGVFIPDETGTPFRDGASPRANARRLCAKAGDDEILCGETVYKYTNDEFRYATIGFYQTRGGKSTVKIYKLVEPLRPAPTRNAGEELYFPPPGFERETSSLLTEVTAARKPRVIIITGGPAAGKTAALNYIARTAKTRGFEILGAAGYRRRQNEPFGAWLGVWRKLTAGSAERIPNDEDVNRALAFGGPAFKIWSPLFAHVLGRDLKPNAYIADAAPRLRRRRTIEIGRDLIFRAAAERPTLVVCDDMWRGDPTSRDVLRSLIAAAGDGPLAFAITAEESPDTFGAATATVFALPATVEAPKGHPFAGSLPAGGVAPAFFKQLWFLNREKIPMDADAVTVAAALDARLGNFPAPWREATATLAAISVPLEEHAIVALGREFFDSPRAAESWTRDLRVMGLVVDSPPDAGDSWAVPPFVKEALGAILTSDVRERDAAARAAARFATRYLAGETFVAASLEKDAGNAGPAAELAVENARKALWLGASLEAGDHLTAVIRTYERGPEPRDKDPDLRARLYSARAETYGELGWAAAALADLDQAALGSKDTPSAEYEIRRAEAYAARGFYDDALSAFTAGEAALRSDETDDLAARAAVGKARALFAQGRADEALSLLDEEIAEGRARAETRRWAAELKYRAVRIRAASETLKTSASSSDARLYPLTTARLAVLEGLVHFEGGRVTHARWALDKAKRIFELAGDATGLGDVLRASARVATQTSTLDESESSWAEALRHAEDENDDAAVAAASIGLATVALLRGEAEKRRRWRDYAAARIERAAPSPTGELEFFDGRASFYADRDWARASRVFREASTAYRRVGDYGGSGNATVYAARAALRAGDAAACRTWLSDPELARRAQESKIFFTAFRKVWGELCAAEGDDGAADRYLRAAAATAREADLWLDNGECLLALATLAPKKTDADDLYRRALWIFEQKGAGLLASQTKGQTADASSAAKI